MNIKSALYIGAFDLPDYNAAAHRVLNNAKCLNKLGIHVSFSDMKKDEIESQYEKYSDSMDVYHRKYPKTFLEYVKYSYSAKEIKKILKKRKDIDCVIVYNIPALMFLSILIYCRLNGLKIISDCTEWYSTSKYNLYKRFDIAFRMKVLNKLVDGVIVISKYLERYYEDKLTVTIPPLVDCDEEKWHKEITEENDAVVLSYCGSPGYKERLDIVINTLSESESNDFRFYIAGIKEEDIHKLYDNVNTKCFGDKIQFLGRISHNDSLSLMANSDFGIVVRESTRTNNAGFPTKFVEYKTLGSSVICTDISNIKDYLDSDDILLPSLTDESIVNAVKLALKKKRKKEFKLNNTFNYENYIDEFENFFNKIGGEN